MSEPFSLYQLHKPQSVDTSKVSFFSHKYWHSNSRKIVGVGGTMVLAGVATIPFDNHFFNMRYDYIPDFRYHYDDYLQYSPAAIMLAMKSCGVKGRSSWGRMATADVFSVAVMSGLVNSLKYSVRRDRPDGSHNNSFPSGHTATAFMCATMLHKEYGTTRSPLYSLLGYSIATTTAVSRLMNNKHWMSDVLVGAGIGIISTELGYFFSDLIFKERGLKKDLLQYKNLDYFKMPNNLKISAGYSLVQTSAYYGNGLGLNADGGASLSLSGAWFLNQNFGLGLKINGITAPFTVDDQIYKENNPSRTIVATDYRSANLSPTLNFSCPLNYGLLVGSHIAPIVNMNLTGKVESYGAQSQYRRNEILVDQTINGGIEAGVSISKMVSSGFGIEIFFDYGAIFSRRSGSYLDFEGTNVPFSHRQNIHLLTIGASASAYLFR